MYGYAVKNKINERDTEFGCLVSYYILLIVGSSNLIVIGKRFGRRRRRQFTKTKKSATMRA